MESLPNRTDLLRILAEISKDINSGSSQNISDDAVLTDSVSECSKELCDFYNNKYMMNTTSDNKDKSVLMFIEYPDDDCEKYPASLCGELFVDDTSVELTFVTKDTVFPMLSVRYINKKIGRLLIKLRNDQSKLLFSGYIENGSFSVLEMHICDAEIDTDDDSNKLNNNQLQYILTRLLPYSASIDEESKAAYSFAFSTISELDLLYKLCKDEYPQEIKESIDYYFQILFNTGVLFSERQHIQRALSYLLLINWNAYTLVPDMMIAGEILEAEFHDLQHVKKRILEIVAQVRHNKTLPRPILLKGPAGVGKTKLCKIIARILNLHDVTIDFSSLKDIEAITGSSRIYSNARPGMILEKLYSVRSANVALILNEIDKASFNGGHGNPTDVLLPLLDGFGFTDLFIEAAIPTQSILFISTCNDESKISKPLLDRFTVIDIPAYTENEKRTILENHVLPQTLAHMSIDDTQFSLSKGAINLLCSNYAVGPGVRDIEQYVERLVSHYIYEREIYGPHSARLSESDLMDILGPGNATTSRTLHVSPGLVKTAYYHNGVVRIVSVEAITREGNGGFITTNIISDIHKDYCRVAYECVQSSLLAFLHDFRTLDVIVHVPDDLPLCASNFLGNAVFAAILSSIDCKDISPDKLFIGGCDLYGNTYYDGNVADQLIAAIIEKGISTVYAPVGFSRHLSLPLDGVNLAIVEGADISELYELV